MGSGLGVVRIGRTSATDDPKSDGCAGSAKTTAKSSGVKARARRAAKVSRRTPLVVVDVVVPAIGSRVEHALVVDRARHGAGPACVR